MIKHIGLITHFLVLLGSLTLGLVGLFDVNLISIVFGSSTVLVNLVYFVIGFSGLYGIMHLTTTSK